MARANRDNLRACYARADSIDREEGKLAYARYNEVLQGIAAHYGYPLNYTVAAFAALSPNTDYLGNLRSLVSLLIAHREGRAQSSVIVSSYGHCARRAWSYLNGISFLGTVRGKKIRSFYANIIDPEDPEPVTIDGHAVNLWRGERRPLKETAGFKFNYDAVAEDFREVAETYGLIPNQLQATLWFTWKRLNRIIYDGNLHLFRAGDQWRTYLSPEEIRPFTPKVQAPGMPKAGKESQAPLLFANLHGDRPPGEES